MKTITIILMSVLMTAIVTAGIFGGLGGASIGTDNLNTLMETSGVGEINPEVSPMVCNEDICRATVFQQDVIDTTISLAHRKCINYDERTRQCLEYEVFTDEDLQVQLQNEITKKLDAYGQMLNDEQSQTQETISDGGTISIGGGGLEVA